LCDSAGVMYWGDAYFHRVETANIDGTGRKVLLADTKAQYFEFFLHAGNIYYTDQNTPYASILFMLPFLRDSIKCCTLSSVCLSRVSVFLKRL